MKSMRSGLLPLRFRAFAFVTLALALTLAALRGSRLATAFAVQKSAAKPASVERPPIVGVAHIALLTDNMAAAREFYGHVLGFAEAFTDKLASGSEDLTFKVNEHQYIEIFRGLKSPAQDRLVNIAFETTDLMRLRDYLASKGVDVGLPPDPAPGKLTPIMLKDPDGHEVEFVQYLTGSRETRDFGKFMPDTRVSGHIIHVGVTVRDRAAADRFYGDILGFKLMWYGGMKDDGVDWVDMRVPEGTDWLEYMLNVHNPSPRTLGVMHHFSLGVTSIQPAYQTVLARGYHAEKPQIGRDGKWQLNLYDPNLTRAEVMEFKPVQTPCCSPMILP